MYFPHPCAPATASTLYGLTQTKYAINLETGLRTADGRLVDGCGSVN